MQNNLFLPVSMLTKMPLRPRAGKPVLFPLALRNSLLLGNRGCKSNPEEDWQTGSTTARPFTQEGVLYVRSARRLGRSSNKKTTNNEQNQPLVAQNRSLSS